MVISWKKSPAEIANSEVLSQLHFHTVQHFVAGVKCEQQAASMEDWSSRNMSFKTMSEESAVFR